jgi:hypothetical protein
VVSRIRRRDFTCTEQIHIQLSATNTETICKLALVAAPALTLAKLLEYNPTFDCQVVPKAAKSPPERIPLCTQGGRGGHAF